MEQIYLQQQCQKLLLDYLKKLNIATRLEQKIEKCIQQGIKISNSSLLVYQRLLKYGEELSAMESAFFHYCNLIKPNNCYTNVLCYA